MSNDTLPDYLALLVVCSGVQAGGGNAFGRFLRPLTKCRILRPYRPHGNSPTRLRCEQFHGVVLRSGTVQVLPKDAYLNNRDVQLILDCVRKSFPYSVSKGTFHGIKNRTLP